MTMDSEVKEMNREPNLIVFARQTFTSLQKDIFTLAVSQLESGLNVQPDLFHNKTVTVTAKMLSEVTEKKYSRLRAECKELAQKVIEISSDEKEEFEFIVPFPRIKYSRGVMELTMFADVAQWFMELKNGYAEYYVRESLSLEHFNKKRLYELLSSYKNRKNPEWLIFDDELKRLFGMDGNEYKGRPAQFERQIISVCVDAINEKTSLTVKYTRAKNSRGWYTNFVIKNKSVKQAKEAQIQQEPEVMPTDEKSQRLVARLKGIGINREDLLLKLVIHHQAACWKWFNDNKVSLENNYFKSNSGVLLVHLGLMPKKNKAV